MYESGDEEADCELTRLVLQDPLHDAGRELPHRELDDDHRDREDKSRQAHHRRCHCAEDLGRGIGAADKALRDRLIVEIAIERDRPEGDSCAGEHAENGDEPEAR